MKYILLTITIFIAGCISCTAQDSSKLHLNILSYELGKTGLMSNIIFDRKLADRNTGFRLGAGYNFAKYLEAVQFGGGIYQLFGRRRHFFELGLELQHLSIEEFSDDQGGFTAIFPNRPLNAFFPSLNFGYRAYRQKAVFRAGLSAAIITSQLIPGAYLSYGYSF